jgi:hypothetical protein
MQFNGFSFGSIRIDGVEYGYDVVIEVELFIASTEQAIDLLKENPPDTNAILHVTC